MNPSQSRDKLPPYSAQAEMGVLGCCLLDSSKTDLALKAGVTFLSFFDQRHAEIFSVLTEIAKNGGGDVLVASIRLQERGKLDGIGGLPYLAGLIDCVPSAENLGFYVPDLQKFVQRRELLKVATQLKILAEDPIVDPATTLAECESVTQSLRRGFTGDSWQSLVEDGSDLIKKPLSPVVQIVNGIVTEKSKLLIGSSAKANKTWISIDLGLSISQGAPWWGRETIKSSVLYVNFELKPDTFARRVQLLASEKGLPIERKTFLHLPLRGRICRATVSTIIDRIIQTAIECESKVVICDPVYKMNVEGEENNSRDQTIFFNQIDRITTDAGCTVILNDHFSKGNQSEKDPLDAIRGSSAKGGDVDAAMVMRKHEIEGCFRVDVILRELAPVEPFCIGWMFPLMHLRPDLDPVHMKKAKGGRAKTQDPQKLLAYIVETSTAHPISISAWADAAGLKRQTLTEYLPGMRTKGWISTVGGGNTARQFITEKGRKAAQVG